MVVVACASVLLPAEADTLDPLKLELQTIVSHATNLGASIRAVHVLNY